MPTISVIVPVYNVEKYIHRCIDSILGQTFTDFELILVDDGSPDSCGTICDEYATKDSRVVVIHQKNGGLSAARNAGIDWSFANSDSQWLAFVDSDDWVHPEYLELLLDAVIMHNTLVSMCFFQETKLPEIQYISSYSVTSVKKDTEELYAEHYGPSVAAFCKLYSKELFKEIRYPVGKMLEDLYTTYKVIFRFDTIAVVEAELYYYYQSPNSIMRSSWSPWKLTAFQAYEEVIAFFDKHGYSRAKKRQVQSYITALAGQWWQICSLESSKELKKTAKMLQRKLQKILWNYRLVLNYSFEKDKWIFEAAYPHLFKIYWIIMAIKHRCKR